MDWETAELSFDDALKAWQKAKGWNRERCSSELRVSLGMFNQWASGKSCSREMSLRRLMTEIDRRDTIANELREKLKTAIDKALE